MTRNRDCRREGEGKEGRRVEEGRREREGKREGEYKLFKVMYHGNSLVEHYDGIESTREAIEKVS